MVLTRVYDKHIPVSHVYYFKSFVAHTEEKLAWEELGNTKHFNYTIIIHSFTVLCYSESE